MNSMWHALAGLAQLHGRRVSWRDLAAHVALVPTQIQPEAAAVALQAHGFDAQVSYVISLAQVERLPVLLRLKSGGWLVWVARDGQQVKVLDYSATTDAQDDAHLPTTEWTLQRLQEAHDGLVLTASPLSQFDAQKRFDTLRQGVHWFWGVFSRLRQHYGDCVVAATLINILGLVSSLFSMNVYDRIIPNAAMHSLWVLAIGVLLAGLMDLGLRTLRAHVLDDAGKRADLALSAAIFRQTLNLNPADRPSSSGQFAGQLREFESVRDFVSSTTLVALTDLPFAVLFFVVMVFIGGPLVWVPLIAAAIIIVMGFISQLPIRQAVERYQYENTQKHAFLVEALERLETIEALGASASLQGRWERVCAITARSAMGSRFISALTLNMSQFVQQSTNTVLIVFGVYLILNGQLTTGALIGCSILSGRALGPLGQIAGLMARWQHTRTAFSSIDKLMGLPVRNDPHQTYIHINRTAGDLQLEQLQFSYPRCEQTVLHIDKLCLKMGEITAIMGPVGSGKSSLLRVLAGLQSPKQGRVMLDGLEVGQISAADWRAQVAWVGQDAILFRGSLRENLLIAAPEISDARFMGVLRVCGLDTLITQHPQGLDMPLGEAGHALSGGQRQMVVLARALLANCPILLLDEPTSAFDMGNEHMLLQRLRPELAGRLVVISTHRAAPLELASRLVILDHGRISADGPRDAVLQAVRDGQVMRQRALEKGAA